MKFLHIFLALFFSMIVLGQEKKTFTVTLGLITEPITKKVVFAGQNIHIDPNGTPLYTKQWTGSLDSEVSYQLKNIKEQVLSGSELSLLDVSNLPTRVTSIFNTVKEGAKSFIRLQLYPIYKKEDGSIVKITRFDLSYNSSETVRANNVQQITQIKEVKNSVLNSGTWYKIAVDKTGVFKVDANFLRSLGVNINQINPKNIRIFGHGGNMLPELLTKSRPNGLQENAIYVKGESDGRFDNDDYILFYGKGTVSWTLNSKTNIQHKQNPYATRGYYYINFDTGQNGKRISNATSISSLATNTITSYTDYRVHEKELYNYVKTGRKWYGEDFSVNNLQTFAFDVGDIDLSTPAQVSVNFSSSSSVNTDCTVAYREAETAAGSDLFTISLGTTSKDIKYRESLRVQTFLPTAPHQFFIDVLWNNNGDLSAKGRLDYIKVIVDRLLVANGNQFDFVNFLSASNGSILEYKINNAHQVDFVWDVTDSYNVKNMLDLNNSDTQFTFKEATDGELNQYQVVRLEDAYLPINIGAETVVENQNLHAETDIQYIILTHPVFSAQAERLANYHRENTQVDGNPINVKVVNLQKVYNEFGSGIADVTAIRDYLKYVYDNASTSSKKLKYVCLFGDATFDYRGITYSNKNNVPTYMSNVSSNLISSYNSDDYYALLDATDDMIDNDELSISGKMEITTGRIPVGTSIKAKQYVDKLLNYYSTNSFGAWRSKVTLLADDGQEGEHQLLTNYLENSAKKTESLNKNINITKLYADAFEEELSAGGGQYPQIVKRLDEAFNIGSVVINYFGHGNTSTLAEENFLDISKIRSYRNLNNLPLFITVTCDFSRFDDPTFLSAGEELMESNYGGAVAMITTTRQIYISAGNSVNSSLTDYLYSFDGKKRTAAEALKDAKNDLIIDGEQFVFFLGDPAMPISIPEQGIKIQAIKKYVIDEEAEKETLVNITELNGLSKIRVEGAVVQKDSVLVNGVYSRPTLSDFNGNLSVVLYDKEIERKTMLNEVRNSGGSVNENDILAFKSLENKVFVGSATINNGQFSFDMMLPKDVSSIPENAKFSFYASSKNNDKIGSDFSYKVGGVDPDAKEDNTAPLINLFLDDESFVNGANTSSTPILLAKLSDESGINTSLNSLGHSISLIIDDELTNPITLNEYYTTEKDDFTKGIVTYQMPELEEGDHTLTLKVWDSHNNSATQTLDFYVQSDLKFKIDRVLNYPNPFINHTEFWFENNRKNEPLEITVQVYTVSGKLIKTIRATDNNTNPIIKAATWDGKDDYGNKLGKGVYLYRIKVKEIISGQSDEKIQKLVLL
ncbi:type IX secretion system sortase PorU [Ochrovirga pacifica]|uniref:type IX secretion system sortase PorU n=1 Tax=Ochrovirga pacifica TaxID=1042376 RepID=UPI000255A038|nr:type IX secretion system sortase PorU [Ochrovirga pacifica]